MKNGATVLIPVVGTFIYRINIEEKALTEQSGTALFGL